MNNRSTDNGEEAAMRYLEEHPLPIPVSLLRNDDNYGLGGSHKVAFEYAVEHDFDYVIVLHGDDQGRYREYPAALTESGIPKVRLLPRRALLCAALSCRATRPSVLSETVSIISCSQSVPGDASMTLVPALNMYKGFEPQKPFL